MTDRSASLLAPGLLVLMLGVFLITRSVTQDDTGRTLIDRILRKPGADPAAAAAAAVLVDPGSRIDPAVSGDHQAPLPVHDLPHGTPGRTVRRPLPRHRAGTPSRLPHGAPGSVRR